jgi:hypothetical protein
VSALDDWDQVSHDLETLLLDVLTSILDEQAASVPDHLPAGTAVCARLGIHDEDHDTTAVVEVRAGESVSRLVAARMLHVADPTLDDVLDAVGELGNIAAGHVKAVLCRSSRLSLPSVEICSTAAADDREGPRVRAAVLGRVVELAVLPGARVDDLLWPPTSAFDALETPS